MANNARIPDVNSLINAGIDPKTGLPIKAGIAPNALKSNLKKVFRIIDEQDAINRFTWLNLPESLDSQLIERILYYRGQGMFFYMETDNNFYFLPYALSGSIDAYGRFTGVTPLPFNGSAGDGKDKPWIVGLDRIPQYCIRMPDDLSWNDYTNKCVLLSDYSKQISQTNISRQILNDPILDVMSDCVPFMRTALLNSTGIQGMRVNSEDEQANVEIASRGINDAALNGKKWIPITGNVDFQDLTSGIQGKSEEFLLSLQSLDNLRLSTYGLENGGLFQKKSHMLEAEQETNMGNVGYVMQDGLTLRQDFCNIVNSIWGLGIWCDVSENQLNIDRNGDGAIGDEQDSMKGNEAYGENMSATEGVQDNE